MSKFHEVEVQKNIAKQRLNLTFQLINNESFEYKSDHGHV